MEGASSPTALVFKGVIPKDMQTTEAGIQIANILITGRLAQPVVPQLSQFALLNHSCGFFFLTTKPELSCLKIGFLSFCLVSSGISSFHKHRPSQYPSTDKS